MLKTITNSFKCKLLHSHICDYVGSNKQYFNIVICYKNSIKIYINDVKVPKRNNYITSTYKKTNRIKIKLIGIFNNQVFFIDANAVALDVSLHSFQKKIDSSSIKAINNLSHKDFNLKSIKQQYEIKSQKKITKTNTAVLSRTEQSKSEIVIPNYNLTNITNHYEQINLPNT